MSATAVKSLNEIRARLREHRAPLAERYGVAVVGIFGSRARGRAAANSDLDLLAEVLRPIGLLELAGAESYLSEVLGLKVDLIARDDIREELRAAIEAEVAPV